MNQKTHKIVYAVINLLVIVGTVEGLIAILNLNQPELFFKTAFYAGIFFIFQIAFLYDLHFKTPGSLKRARLKHANHPDSSKKNFKIALTAISDRLDHLLSWKFLRLWIRYLILPGIIYWGSIMIFFLNFGFPKVQQIIVVFSSLAFFANYFYLKEIFRRKTEVAEPDIFVILSTIKIYACFLVYSSIVAIVKSYCLNDGLLFAGILACTFLLLYQALFQHRMVTNFNLAVTFIISLIMSLLGMAVLWYWGYNYFTAGVFLTACYNLMWGIFHYYLDKALSWKVFLEILLISGIIAGMLLSITNFKARILDGCQYGPFRVL